MREFDSGATRDNDETKLDYEGFLDPEVLHQFARYMHKHRVQADGTLRASDNWQKGMPRDAYMKSLWRHFMDIWHEHRNPVNEDVQLEACMAAMFNIQGYARELIREFGAEVQT